ncbi:hypothetical protein ACLVWU_08460 [Bdellovibrio sp. HCB290]|uniref:hypothetical protein n=1 Tax=Bdellovibrio sp. HCB290 TaxID=3394356 RepID=UPI0039B4BE06
MNLTKQIFLAVAFCGSILTLAHAAEKVQHEKDIPTVKKYIPKEFFKLKGVVSEEPLKLGDGIGYSFESDILFDGPGKSKYLVALYMAAPSFDDTQCVLSVFKDGKPMGKTVLQGEETIAACGEMIFDDLDGDGKPEVMVTLVDLKGYEFSRSILVWNGDHLKDVTPVSKTDGGRIVGSWSPSISDALEGKSKLIIDSGESGKQTGIYVLRDGKIEQIASYDWYRGRDKETGRLRPINEKLNLPAGTYTLEVKNRSADQTKAVRAQVQVGANIVIKPNAMCAGPAPAGYKPPNDGDGNEDKNKGCVPRKSTYATVTLKGNEVVKVTGYGATGSYLEVTLLKK